TRTDPEYFQNPLVSRRDEYRGSVLTHGDQYGMVDVVRESSGFTAAGKGDGTDDPALLDIHHCDRIAVLQVIVDAPLTVSGQILRGAIQDYCCDDTHRFGIDQAQTAITLIGGDDQSAARLKRDRVRLGSNGNRRDDLATRAKCRDRVVWAVGTQSQVKC